MNAHTLSACWHSHLPSITWDQLFYKLRHSGRPADRDILGWPVESDSPDLNPKCSLTSLDFRVCNGRSLTDSESASQGKALSLEILVIILSKHGITSQTNRSPYCVLPTKWFTVKCVMHWMLHIYHISNLFDFYLQNTKKIFQKMCHCVPLTSIVFLKRSIINSTFWHLVARADTSATQLLAQCTARVTAERSRLGGARSVWRARVPLVSGGSRVEPSQSQTRVPRPETEAASRRAKPKLGCIITFLYAESQSKRSTKQSTLQNPGSGEVVEKHNIFSVCVAVLRRNVHRVTLHTWTPPLDEQEVGIGGFIHQAWFNDDVILKLNRMAA